MARLSERWRAEIPGELPSALLVDPAGEAVFIGDGWSVPFAAVRLHRLDLHTGNHLADVRTRHQTTGALALDHGNLYAATDSRLFELDPVSLAIRRQWDRGLVRYTTQLLPHDGLLVAANWLRPSIGIFDPDTGRTRLVRAGGQPLLLLHDGQVKVISGFEGGLGILDVQRARLQHEQATVPIAKVAVGDQIWAVAAGPPRGGQGDPPVWTRHGSNVLLRLTGLPLSVALPGDCDVIDCDDQRQVVWCLTGGPRHDLIAVSQGKGAVIARFNPPAGFAFNHVSAAAGLVFAIHTVREVQGNVVISATSTCLCLTLPPNLEI